MIARNGEFLNPVNRCFGLLASVVFCLAASTKTQATTTTETNRTKDARLCSQMSSFLPNMCQLDLVKANCQNACAKEQTLGCGKRSTFRKRYRRIVGGNESEVGEWPWHVSIQLDNKHDCGGSILSPEYIITAAHCLDGAYTSDEPSRFTVVAGTNYHSKIKQRIAVRTFKNHPDYKVSTHNRSDSFFVYVANDLAIIKLAERLELGSSNKEAVCLPDKSNIIPDNYECYIVGFGKTAFEANKSSEELRHAKINRVPVEVCNEPDSFNQTINSSNSICAGDGTPSISPCKFDSGGGLVCQKNDTWYISGIISSGYKCGGVDAYSLYANIAEYEEWIVKTLFELDAESGHSSSRCIQISTVCINIVLTTIVLNLAF